MTKTLSHPVADDATMFASLETSGDQVKKLDAVRWMSITALGYWLVFWGMNGLDKFLNRTDLGMLTWYGKDRTAQFTEYFDRMEVNTDLINPVLGFAGIWELVVAVPFLLAAIWSMRGPLTVRMQNCVTIGFAAGAATFIAFSLFDVIAGDRAELREHGLYLILLLGCWGLSVWSEDRRA